MKKIILLFCVILFLGTLSSKAQHFEWAQTQQNMILGSKVAAGTNLVAVTSRKPDTTGFGIGVVALTVRNNNGNFLWQKEIAGDSDYPDYYPKVAIDKNQNIIVYGTFEDSLYIDSLLFRGQPFTQSIYLIKFDAQGNLLWAERSTSSFIAFLRDLKLGTDDLNNIYLGGSASDSLVFNNTAVITPGYFVTKVSQTGTVQWVTTFNPQGNSELDMAISPTGEVYVNSLDDYKNPRPPFGVPHNPLLTKFTVTKLTTHGNLTWQKPVSGFGYNLKIASDDQDHVYVTGSYDVFMTFDSLTNLTLNGANHSWFLAKLSSQGDWKWAKTIGTDIFQPPYLHYQPGFLFNANQNLSLSFSSAGNGIFGGQPAESSPFANSNTFIAEMDTAGTLLWLTKIRGAENSITGLAADPLGNLYLAGPYRSGTADFGGIQLSANANQHGVYLTKVHTRTNLLQAFLFIDTNGNGVKDTGERTHDNGMLEITPGPRYLMGATNGQYEVHLPSGNFNVQVLHPAHHYTFSPQNHSVTFSGAGQTQTREFALAPIPNRNDVKVSVTPNMAARPGFLTSYHITLENVGTTTLSDSVSLQYDVANLNFYAANPLPDHHLSGWLQWYYQNLEPAEKRHFLVDFIVPIYTPINAIANAIAVAKPIATDFFPDNNTDTLNHTVTGSFDPNDKLVSYEALSPAQVANGQLLDYVIRFQNTGTDTAFTVIVRDSISSKLHMPSFELLSASHPYTFRFLENGLAEWRFDNILLPDSNRNEPASHGFIRYRMKPKTSLVLGDEIKERAAIYFDFNAPVITNYAITRIANPLSIKKPKAGLQPFQLYPNPAQNYVMVAAELKKPTAATVRLVNILGQVISEVTLPANNQLHYQLPLHNLPKGVYIVQLETENGRQAQRLVVQ